MSTARASLLVALTTVASYVLTMNPATKGMMNSAFVLYIVVVTVGFIYYPVIRRTTISSQMYALYMTIMFVCILCWVGVTGWFLSPFFYLLYLVGIVLSFVFSPTVTFVFVMTLLGLFSPNIGSIDLMIDIITVLSLFSVVPLTYFLQKEFLRLKQDEKKVLILDEATQKNANKKDVVLANKVNKFAVEIRQNMNDIKQISSFAGASNQVATFKKALNDIYKLSSGTLKDLETFEEHTTGKKLVHNK